MIKDYHDLEVYKRGYKLALQIHKTTKGFPQHELYEIGSQIRRATVSIPLNIAEGYGRKNYVDDFKRFLINALGSCNEVAVLLDMIKDLGYISDQYEGFKEEYDYLGRQLNKLIQTWK
ncbi:S23 ribosomal protein [Desulforamulus reducens MI-1]|uniref:S23 ribosomal protein n=1 Tax=Desulforamulus reducens (strain ATCC BAA-1160 / DSM 100696 / MI-1) TaxID=349161 RepID=A4J1K0_DESRM|nr:S23 ribosomal protein [Desulforamulus reducens MI-1]